MGIRNQRTPKEKDENNKGGKSVKKNAKKRRADTTPGFDSGNDTDSLLNVSDDGDSE